MYHILIYSSVGGHLVCFCILTVPVVRYRCDLDRKESWALKNWCFQTQVLEKTLQVPWTASRSSQSVPKEINSGYSLEGLMRKLPYLATWWEELTHWKRPWCWERLTAGGEVDDWWWDGWMASPTQCTWVWVDSGSWWWTGRPGMLCSMGLQRVRHDWVTELNWTEQNPRSVSCVTGTKIKLLNMTQT